MTLGEKIKKYRKLKGMTQKELGIAVGFSEATADSRIRKYESNLNFPKDGMRARLVDALGVDLSAISDIDIATEEDVMQALFLFEELFDMDVKKKDGKTLLIFDNSNEKIRKLITYMNIWASAKQAYMSKNPTVEQKRAYEIWKSKAFGNIKEYFSEKENAILNYYQERLEQENDNTPCIGDTLEIALLLRKIIASGFTVSTASYDGGPESANGITFVVDELLVPPSEEAARLFARFLNVLRRFNTTEEEIRLEMHMTDKKLSVTWFVSSEAFRTVRELTDFYLRCSQNEGLNDCILEISNCLDQGNAEFEITRGHGDS